MKPNPLLRTAWAVLASCLIAHSARATLYYVNANTGSDTNSGTSATSPWQTLDRVNNGPTGVDVNGNPSAYQPGDGLRLARGSVWNGVSLYPRGSGTAASPITIDAYGSGSLPVINAAGAYPKYLQVPRTESAAVWLYNQKYVEVRNLELTNFVTSLAQFDTPSVTQDAFRWGILVEAENGQGGDAVTGSTTYEFPHIYISKNTTHHVEGYDSEWDPNLIPQKQFSTGGINLTVGRTISNTMKPLADTYVYDGSNATNNFGTATTLNVKSGAVGYNRQSLLQFSLPTTTNTVNSAVIRVYGQNSEDNTSVPVTAYDVPNSWSETGVTWNTRPASEPLAGVFRSMPRRSIMRSMSRRTFSSRSQLERPQFHFS